MTADWPDPPEPRAELKGIQPYKPGKPLDEISRDYDFDGEPVKLASNENPYSPPSSLCSVYEEEFDRLNRYPDGGCYYLRQAIAQKYQWPPEGIVIGAGSDEITDFLSKVYLAPGDEVIVADPSFIRQTMLPKIMGAKPVQVPVKNDFTVDLKGMLEAVNRRTRWICLPNPNNPTSRYVPEDDLRAFLGELPPDLLVILDEAYFEFMDQDDYPDGRDVLDDFTGRGSPSIVLQRSFSKAYGLSGLRVGYGLMNPSIAHEIHKVRPPFNVTRPGQRVAREALGHDRFLSESREKLREERGRLLRELRSRGIDFVEPSANFLLLEVPEGSTGESFCEEFRRRGIIIRSMTLYGLEHHVRVSVGTATENDQFLEALGEILE